MSKRDLRSLLFTTAAVLLMGTMAWAAWYAYNKGFSRSWRNRVEAEFRRHGVEVELRRLTLDPIRGLVAQDVDIFADQSRDEVVASISEISLDIHFANLLRQTTFLNAVDLRNTRLSIPIPGNDGKGERFDVDSLKARIVFPPRQIRLSQLECRIHGIMVSASGNLLLPEGVSPEFPKAEGAADYQWLERLVGELRQTSFPGAKPRVEIEFSADLSNPESLRIEHATLQSGPVLRDRFSLDSLFLEMTLANGDIRMQQCRVKGAGGELLAKGHFSLDSRKGTFQLRSSLELQAVLLDLFPANSLKELTFYDPPRVDAYGDIDLDSSQPVSVVAEVEFGRFALRSILFETFHTQLSWNGDRLLLNDLTLENRTGSLQASLLVMEEDMRVQLESTIDPTSLIPLVDGKTAAFLEEWRFADSPKVTLSGRGPKPGLDTLEASGRIELGRSSYRNVDLLSASSDFLISNRAVTYRDFKVERNEGDGSGTFIYDFGRGEARLEGVRCNMHPEMVARWIDPEFVDDVLPYRFPSPPEVVANGTVKLRGGKGNNLVMRVAGAKGMTYRFLGEDLPFRQVDGTLRIRDHALKLENMRGALFDGDVAVNATISVDPVNPGYESRIRVENADFASLTGLYFDYTESRGRVSGEYAFQGRKEDSSDMTGNGRIEVVNGDVFSIPILGPFSEILNNIVPGMGYSLAKKATASFRVNDGSIRTDDFEVEAEGFAMYGHGAIDYLQDRIDFDIRINAKGLPGVLLFPVSKLFEYTADGTLDNPGWKPKLFQSPGQGD